MKDGTQMTPTAVTKAGRALVKARRAAKKARQRMDEAYAAIHACAGDKELRDQGIQFNRLGEMLAHLGEGMKCESHVMQAHGCGADLLKDCGIDAPDDDEIIAQIR